VRFGVRRAVPCRLAFEIQNSLAPIALRRWMNLNINDDDRLSSVFPVSLAAFISTIFAESARYSDYQYRDLMLAGVGRGRASIIMPTAGSH
jgi:hypothetical protein